MLETLLRAHIGDEWRDVLDELARARNWATSHDVVRLGKSLAELSAAYNDVTRAALSRPKREWLGARLVFSFVRDVPKVTLAVREVVSRRALALPSDRPLRVLDLGAGLGASSWGLVRAFALLGQQGRIEVDAIDTDRDALDLNAALVRNVARQGDVELVVHTGLVRTWSDVESRSYDVVLLGQVLSELDVELSGEERVTKHATLVTSLLAQLESSGFLVIVEPALRATSRHLHKVRDAVLANEHVSIHGPCVHRAGCPALLRESDWCHEDVDLALPQYLVPVARAAGLRYEGITFSYVILSTRGVASLPPTSAVYRVVSRAMISKGKRELHLCGYFAQGETREVAATKVDRLDRDITPSNAAWDELCRGDLLEVDSPLNKNKPRVSRVVHLRLIR